MTALNRKNWWIYQTTAWGFFSIIYLLTSIILSKFNLPFQFPVIILVPLVIAYLADLRRAQDTEMAHTFTIMIFTSYAFSIMTYLTAQIWDPEKALTVLCVHASVIILLALSPSAQQTNQYFCKIA